MTRCFTQTCVPRHYSHISAHKLQLTLQLSIDLLPDKCALDGSGGVSIKPNLSQLDLPDDPRLSPHMNVGSSFPLLEGKQRVWKMGPLNDSSQTPLEICLWTLEVPDSPLETQKSRRLQTQNSTQYIFHSNELYGFEQRIIWRLFISLSYHFGVTTISQHDLQEIYTGQPN